MTVIIMKQTLQITSVISPMFSLHSKSPQCVFKMAKDIQWNSVYTDTKGACQSVRIIGVSVLKGHCHEHNFKNSTAQKHVYTFGNLLTVVKFS